jgi:PEP-CTERM motif
MELSRVFIRGLVALVVIVGVAAVTPARAISYAGKWDPAFESAFPDLGWRGEAIFFLPDACLAQSGWILNGDSCSAFGMRIVSAEVEFYKLSDSTNPAFQETLSFNVASPAVASMKLDSNGLLTDVYGTFLYTLSSTLPFAGGPYTDFLLFFQGDLARMIYESEPPGGKKIVGISDRNPPDGRPVMTFSVVPEPGSVTLALAALLVIAFLLRRRAD